MAKGLQRKRQRQQQAAELQQLRAIVDSAAVRHAFSQPPVPRPGHQWDWQCGTCGHVNFSGRTLCHKHLCIGPRSKGHTMVGFKRGVQQDSAVAQTARLQQLQTLSLPSAYQVPATRPHPEGYRGPPNVDRPHQSHQRGQQQQQRQRQQQIQQQAPTRRVLQPAKTTVVARRTTNVNSDSGGYARSLGVPEAGNSCATQAQSEQPRIAQQYVEDENVADPEDEETEEPTDYEDLDADPLILRKRHVNLARVLERREKRLAKERARIEEQHTEIANQKAKLVEFQLAANSTASEIEDLQNKVSATCQQLARIEEKNKGATAVAALEGGPTPEQHARDCLERTVAAFQHFQGQSPQVQCLLQQFVAIFDSLRVAEAVDANQATLEQAFARTASQTPAAAAQNVGASSPPLVVPTVDPIVDTKQTTLEQTLARAAASTSSCVGQLHAIVALGDAAAENAPAPQSFDIGSEISATEITPESVQVVGHSVGDKRKQEHLHDAERISREEAVARESLPADTPTDSVEDQSVAPGSSAVEVDAQGANATPAVLGPWQKTYTKRDDLCKDLEESAARKRFSPYAQLHV